MLKYLMVFSFAALLALPDTVLAQQNEQPCNEITNPTERLACYDRTFEPDPGKPVAQKILPPIETKPVNQDPPAAPDRPASEQSSVSEPTPPSTASKGGLFSAKEKLNISSQLTSIRDKDKQKMVFRLANEQIWLQDAPRSLPFREGEEVTIKSATIGGYILSNNKGVSTRVRRIK